MNEFTARFNPDFPHSDMRKPFTGRLLVMHIAIVVGGVLYAFVSRRFTTIFTPENLWSSALIALPFLLLKSFMILKEHKENNATVRN